MSFYSFLLICFSASLHFHLSFLTCFTDITIRGHTVFWAKTKWVQQWVQDLSNADLQSAMETRVKNLISRYKERLIHWDVNNEMLDGSFYKDRLGESIRPWMFNRVKELDPSTLTFVNDYNIIRTPYEVDEYKQQITGLINQGAIIDGIGVQGHFVVDRPVDGAQVKASLDSLAELNLPIWITEYDSMTSDVEQRADDLETVYRVAFAHPAVKGILMWGFWELEHWRGADGALVDADWTVNAAGQRYQQLMEEWKTSLNGLITNTAGKTDAFRGFHGKYAVTVNYPDDQQEVFEVYLPSEGGDTGEVEFNLQKSQ